MAQGKKNEDAFFHKKPYALCLMPFFLSHKSRFTTNGFTKRDTGKKKGRAFWPAPLTVSAVMSSSDYFTKGAGIG